MSPEKEFAPLIYQYIAYSKIQSRLLSKINPTNTLNNIIVDDVHTWCPRKAWE